MVAKCFTQIEGVNYDKTFSPVVKFLSIHPILSLVAHMDLELFHMDVKTAFLNGDLDEDIYMQWPIDFIIHGQENKVCKLRKSIYGLKQSSRQWYIKFHNAILSFGFQMIEEDHYVFEAIKEELCHSLLICG